MKRKRNRRKRADEPKYTNMASIFPRLDSAKHKEVSENAFAGAKVELDSSIQNLVAILKDAEPLLLISMLATYCLTGWGKSDKTLEDIGESDLVLPQPSIEFLFALALTIPISERGVNYPDRETVESTLVSLSSVQRCFAVAGSNYVESGLSDREVRGGNGTGVGADAYTISSKLG